MRTLRNPFRFGDVTDVCRLSTGLIALFALAGWVLHAPALIQLLPGASPMKVNTALGLLFAAAGLRRAGDRSRFVGGFGAVFLLLGVLTLAEHVSGLAFAAIGWQRSQSTGAPDADPDSAHVVRPLALFSLTEADTCSITSVLSA